MNDSKLETVFGVTAVLTAGGVLTFALFPLILPAVVLLAVLALPLVPLVPVAIVVWLAIAVVRRVRPRGSGRRAPARPDPKSATRPVSATVRPATDAGRRP